jgi:hypothetical protein
MVLRYSSYSLSVPRRPRHRYARTGPPYSPECVEGLFCELRLEEFSEVSLAPAFFIEGEGTNKVYCK